MITSRLYALVLCFGLLTVSAPGCSFAAAPFFPSPSHPLSSLQNVETWLLAPGSVRKEEISPAQEHSYTLELEARRYLRLTVDQLGADLTLRLLAPDGSVVKESDLGATRWRSQILAVLTREPGRHTLQLRSEAGEKGRYRLSVDQWRPATADDALRVEAEDALQEGRRLKAQDSRAAKGQALGVLAESTRLWQQLGDASGEGWSQFESGQVLFLLDEYGLALDRYESARRAFEAVDDAAGVAETLNAEGETSVQLGDFERARKAYVEALQIGEELADLRLQALSRNNLGALSYRRGDVPAGLDHFVYALNLQRQLDPSLDEVATLLNLGTVHWSLGKSAGAVKYSEEGLSLARQLDDFDYQVTLLNNLGTIYRRRGETHKALELYDQTLDLARRLGARDIEALAASNLGNLYKLLGEPTRALELYELAHRLNQELDSQPGEARNLLEMGRLHQFWNEPDRALELYAEALEKSRAAGDTKVQGYLLHAMGLAHISQGKSRVAVEFLSQALELQEASSSLAAQLETLRDLGRAYRDLGDVTKASQAFDRSVDLARVVGDPHGEARTRFEMARLERAEGNLEAAHGHMRAGLFEVEALRSEVPGPDLRASFFSRNQDNFAFYIDLLLDLHRRRPEQSYDEEAFEAAERARARSLLELLTEARIPMGEGIPPELLERQRETTFRLSEVQNRLIQALSQQEVDQERVDRLRRDLNAVRGERESLAEAIRVKAPRYATIRYPQPLALDAVMRRLAPDEALLEYVLGDERSWLFVLTRDDFGVRELPPRGEVAALVDGVVGSLARRSHRQGRFRSSARRLYEFLVQPATDLLKDRRCLLIVPDGELYYLPFEALVDPSQDVAGVSPTYLLSQWAVAYVPSASVLVSLKRQEDSPQWSKTLVTFAAPKVPGTQAETTTGPGERNMRGGGLDQDSWRWLALPGSRLEAKTIARFFPEEEVLNLVGPDASEQAMKERFEVRSARYLHFASHANIDEENPAYSTLLLSPGPHEDGLLQVHEIFQLRLEASLVVLSACRTGIGKHVRGEGLIGLTRAFLYAGSRSVLATLWPVQDRPTAELMTAFYAELKAGSAKAEALRQAKLQALSKGGPGSLPHYWAPFILTGDPG